MLLVFAVGLGGLESTPCQGQLFDFRVMSLNVWVGDSETEALANIIEAGQADVVGLQEMQTASGQALADRLGWFYGQQSDSRTQILSRFPITAQTSDRRGAKIEFQPGHSAWLFNNHLTAFPYQPYDLRDNPSLSESQLIASAEATRGAEIDGYLDSVRANTNPGDRVIMTGDFNEPSHLDWTEAAAATDERSFDKKVAWPASTKMANEGFTDTFRHVRPDEVNDRGYTWTPGEPPPTIAANEVHDRIDYVYAKGDLVATQSQTVGLTTDNPNTDIAVPGYVTDHRAVVTRLEVGMMEDSTLTFSRLQHNPGSDIALTVGNYGDRLAATPNIEVDFAVNGNGHWDTYDGDADGFANNWNVGVAQLQSSDASAEFLLSLDADEGYLVTLDSFELVDYVDFAAGHSVGWQLFNTGDGGEELITSGLETIAADGRNQITFGSLASGFKSLSLRLDHLSGDRTDLAFDNLRFSQVVAVPEPGGLALGAAGLLGWMALRKRSRRREIRVDG